MKCQAAGRQDQFLGSVLKARERGGATTGRRGTPVTIYELEGCFDSLATAATTEKTTLDEFIKTNSTLTSSIAGLADMETRLTKEVASLSHEMNKYKEGVQEINVQRGNPAKYFPNYKRDTWHKPDDCFELEKNAHKRHPR